MKPYVVRLPYTLCDNSKLKPTFNNVYYARGNRAVELNKGAEIFYSLTYAEAVAIITDGQVERVKICID
jgi:hypothetical protein